VSRVRIISDEIVQKLPHAVVDGVGSPAREEKRKGKN
jgi:hypothetical protein